MQTSHQHLIESVRGSSSSTPTMGWMPTSREPSSRQSNPAPYVCGTGTTDFQSQLSIRPPLKLRPRAPPKDTLHSRQRMTLNADKRRITLCLPSPLHTTAVIGNDTEHTVGCRPRTRWCIRITNQKHAITSRTPTARPWPSSRGSSRFRGSMAPSCHRGSKPKPQ